MSRDTGCAALLSENLKCLLLCSPLLFLQPLTFLSSSFLPLTLFPLYLYLLFLFTSWHTWIICSNSALLFERKCLRGKEHPNQNHIGALRTEICVCIRTKTVCMKNSKSYSVQKTMRHCFFPFSCWLGDKSDGLWFCDIGHQSPAYYGKWKPGTMKNMPLKSLSFVRVIFTVKMYFHFMKILFKFLAYSW